MQKDLPKKESRFRRFLNAARKFLSINKTNGHFQTATNTQETVSATSSPVPHTLTPEQQQESEKHTERLKFLHGYGFRNCYEITSNTQKTVIGIGDSGLHCRAVDKSEYLVEDELLGMNIKEEGDVDFHKSIKRSAITDITILKEKLINPLNSEKQLVQWEVYVIYKGGQLIIPFPEHSLQQAIEFKRILRQWIIEMPIAPKETLVKLTKQQ